VENEELVPLVRVGFSIRVKVGYGDTVAIVGSSPGLGEWNVARALKLSWSQDADGCDIWTGMAPLPEHWVLRYKVRLWGAVCAPAALAVRLARESRAHFAPDKAWQAQEGQLVSCFRVLTASSS
jgi:Starch binding domain